MVEVDGVGVDYVGRGCCGRIDIFVELAGIEWGVVVVTEGEGDCVSRWLLEADPPAHEVLCESLLSVCVEVEASSPVSTSEGPVAAAPPARRSGIAVVVAIVGGRHCCGEVE